MSLTNEQIVDAIAEKSLMEVMELVKAIERSSASPPLLRLPWLLPLARLLLLKSRPNSSSP